MLNLFESIIKSGLHLALGLNIHPGDPREVQEGTKNLHTLTECVSWL